MRDKRDTHTSDGGGYAKAMGKVVKLYPTYETDKSLSSKPQSDQINNRRWVNKLTPAYQTDRSLASKPQSNQINNRRRYGKGNK